MLKSLIGLAVIIYCMFQAGMVVAKNKDKVMKRTQNNTRILLRMLEIKDSGVRISQKLGLDGNEKIAIYGNGIVGKQIIKQLSLEGVSVAYVVDRACSTFRVEDIPVYRSDMKLPKADVMIITPTDDYANIKHKLEHKEIYQFVSVNVLLEG